MIIFESYSKTALYWQPNHMPTAFVWSSSERWHCTFTLRPNFNQLFITTYDSKLTRGIKFLPWDVTPWPWIQDRQSSESSSLKCLRSERPPFTASSWTARKKLKLSLNTYFKTLSSSFIPLKMKITNQSYFPAVLKHKRDRIIICMLTSSYLSWRTIRQLVFL